MHKIRVLVKKLEQIQENQLLSANTAVFPSVRKSLCLPYQRTDNNLFFTSLILDILQKIRVKDGIVQEKIAKIKARAYPYFRFYRNKAGGLTYNFWKEHPKEAFPNSKWLFKHKHFHIPDDLDDTAMAFLAKPHLRSEVFGLKRRAAVHINTYRKWVTNIFPDLRHFRTYTTWSGQKIYYEFDLCVLINLLVCFRHYRLANDYYDKEAVRFIEQVLRQDYHLRFPYEVSPHYAHRGIILYHLAKLSAADPVFGQKWRTKIKTDLQKIWHKQSSMGKIMLSNALMKMGFRAPELTFSDHPEVFPFFIIGLLTPYRIGLVRKMAQWRISRLVYHCEAYSLALKLEYRAKMAEKKAV